MDELKEINLGIIEDSPSTFVSALLPNDKVEEMKVLLYEFEDYFAWTYSKMLSLPPDMAVHKLVIKFDAKSIK